MKLFWIMSADKNANPGYHVVAAETAEQAHEIFRAECPGEVPVDFVELNASEPGVLYSLSVFGGTRMVGR